MFRVDNEKVGLLSVAAANGRSTLAVQIVDARTGRAELSSELATPGTVTSTNSLLVGSTGPGEPSTSLVWVDAGRLQSLKLGARLRQPFTLAKSAPALQVVDVGLASRGIFILLHQDGTAATVACIDGNLERSWEFGDAVSSARTSPPTSAQEADLDIMPHRHPLPSSPPSWTASDKLTLATSHTRLRSM